MPNVTGSISKLAGGFAMVAADRSVADQAGVTASYDATYGRYFSMEGPSAKPSLGL